MARGSPGQRYRPMGGDHRSSGVAEAGSDAVDGEEERPPKLWIGLGSGRADPFEERDLQIVNRRKEGGADVEGPAEDGIARKQVAMAGNPQDLLDSPLMFGFDHVEKIAKV